MIGFIDRAYAAMGQAPDPDDTAELAAAPAAAVTALGDAELENAYESGVVLDETSAFGLGWDVHCLSTASA
jgi:hypothetical protein